MIIKVINTKLKYVSHYFDGYLSEKRVFWKCFVCLILCSAGLELVQQVEQPPDVVLVCCGGGGLFAGISAALRLSGWTKTRIYGVEPQNGKELSRSYVPTY